MELPARGVLALAVLGCVLAVVMNPSLAVNLSKVPADSADRLFQSWQMAWNGYALLNQPADFLDSNIFWPLDDTAAFSDALFGFTPAGLAGSGPGAAVVRYNLVFLFTYASAFLAAALLARELGLGWPAAVLAGAAFAFTPWRLAHLNHLHVLGSAPIPLCLFLLLRGYRRRRAGLVVAGFAAAAWQVSIGFTLGIPLAYLLGVLGVVAAFWWWRADPRRPLPRRMVGATAAGGAILAGWSLLQALPYLGVLERHPEARRTVDFVRFYSPPPRSFLVAPPNSTVWGDLSAPTREGLAWAPEMALFPGATILLLAVAGLALPAGSRRWRLGLGLGVLGSCLLALGYSIPGGGLYGLLYELAPGWQASRTPGRMFTFATLALALLAGMGAQGLAGLLRGRRSEGDPDRRIAAVALAVPTILAAAVLGEGMVKLPDSELTEPQVRRLPASEPQMHLPTDDFNDLQAVFWSIDGFPDIVNGYSGFTPALHSELRRELIGFPDPRSVDRLRRLGVRTVVLHVDRARPTPWAGAETRPTEGLPLRRVSSGQMVVFHLEPAPRGEVAP